MPKESISQVFLNVPIVPQENGVMRKERLANLARQDFSVIVAKKQVVLTVLKGPLGGYKVLIIK